MQVAAKEEICVRSDGYMSAADEQLMGAFALDDEVDAAVGALMSIMEPILIIGMGLTIRFIVVALFMPLVDIINNMK